MDGTRFALPEATWRACQAYTERMAQAQMEAATARDARHLTVVLSIMDELGVDIRPIADLQYRIDERGEVTFWRNNQPVDIAQIEPGLTAGQGESEDDKRRGDVTGGDQRGSGAAK